MRPRMDACARAPKHEPHVQTWIGRTRATCTCRNEAKAWLARTSEHVLRRCATATWDETSWCVSHNVRSEVCHGKRMKEDLRVICNARASW